MQLRPVFYSGIHLLAVLNGGAQTAGPILWEFDIGTYQSSPALATDGTIYVGGSNKLYAINANGTLKWDFSIINPQDHLLGPDGTIYVGQFDPLPPNPLPQTRFLAINPDGTLKWEFSQQVHNEIRAAVGRDGTIYVASRHFLHALSPAGSRLWSFTNQFADACSGPAYFGFPAIGSDGTVYVPSGHPDNRLFAFSTNGMTNWTFSTGRVTYEDGGECSLLRIGERWSAPAIGADGTVYVGAQLAASDPSLRRPALYAVNLAGSANWQCLLGGNIMPADAAPAIGLDGTIYMHIYSALPGSSSVHKLVAVSVAGSYKWAFVIPGFSASSSPVITTDGSALIGSTEGKLFAVESDGTTASFFSLPNIVTYATVAPDGVIYAVSGPGRPGEGKLYAVAGRAGPANTSWPMYRRDSTQSGRARIHATTQPTLLSLRRTKPTDFELAYTGELSRDYHIETSSNLLHWRVVNTFFSSRPHVQFRDSAARDAGLRFYRLRSP